MIAVVLAGGGERVVAWEVGVLAGLADGGIDPRRAAAVLGTSAGARVAARVAAGVDPRADANDIAAAPPGRHGGETETFVTLAAAWESAGASTAERVRAPVTIGGRPLIDGALGSATNADALASVDAWLTIIITPVPADPAATGPERLWLTALREEVAGLERHGRHVVVVQASSEEREAMGPDPMSAATAPLAMAAGRERGRSVAGQISPRRAA